MRSKSCRVDQRWPDARPRFTARDTHTCCAPHPGWKSLGASIYPVRDSAPFIAVAPGRPYPRRVLTDDSRFVRRTFAAATIPLSAIPRWRATPWLTSASTAPCARHDRPDQGSPWEARRRRSLDPRRRVAPQPEGPGLAWRSVRRHARPWLSAKLFACPLPTIREGPGRSRAPAVKQAFNPDEEEGDPRSPP